MEIEQEVKDIEALLSYEEIADGQHAALVKSLLLIAREIAELNSEIKMASRHLKVINKNIPLMRR